MYAVELRHGSSDERFSNETNISRFIEIDAKKNSCCGKIIIFSE